MLYVKASKLLIYNNVTVLMARNMHNFDEKWRIIISQKRKTRLGLRELLKESKGKKNTTKRKVA